METRGSTGGILRSRRSPTLGHRPELDGIRGIAILLVMAYHTPGRIEPWTKFGWAGVDLFFVLSGFLITGILLDTADNPDRARRFYVRRALRILPLSYAAILLVPIVFALDPLLRDDAHRLAAHSWWLWTYTVNWPLGFLPEGAKDPLPFLDHFWSLAIEEQFYLLWPLVVWHTSRKTAIRVAVVVICGAFVCRVVFRLMHAPWSSSYFLTPSRLDPLGVGALVALWLREPGPEDDLRSRVDRRMQWAGLSAVIVLAIVGMYERTLSGHDSKITLFGYSAVAWLFGWLVTRGALWPSRVLRSPVLVAAGKYSYGLYVIHPLVLDVFTPRLGRDSDLAGVAMWVISIPLAWLSYHGFEQWFLRLKDRLGDRGWRALPERSRQP